MRDEDRGELCKECQHKSGSPACRLCDGGDQFSEPGSANESKCTTCRHKACATFNMPCRTCIPSKEGFPNWQPEELMNARDHIRNAKESLNAALNDISASHNARQSLPSSARELIDAASSAFDNPGSMMQKAHEVFAGNNTRHSLGRESAKGPTHLVAVMYATARALRYVLGGGPICGELQLKIQLGLAKEFSMPQRCQSDDGPSDSTVNGQFGRIANLLHRAYRNESKIRKGGCR